jgi:hypothetical protein
MTVPVLQSVQDVCIAQFGQPEPSLEFLLLRLCPLIQKLLSAGGWPAFPALGLELCDFFFISVNTPTAC